MHTFVFRSGVTALLLADGLTGCALITSTANMLVTR